MPSALTYRPTVLAAYLRDGEEGLARIADRLHDAAHERPEGALGKGEALYLPQSPFPPVLWRPVCERCRFWREGGPGVAGRCHVVGRPGDRFGGEAIHPRGWCAFHTPPEGEPAFAWFHERLAPSGSSAVRGQYRLAYGERDVESGSRRRDREVPVTVRREAGEAEAGEAEAGEAEAGEDPDSAGGGGNEPAVRGRSEPSIGGGSDSATGDGGESTDGDEGGDRGGA